MQRLALNGNPKATASRDASVSRKRHNTVEVANLTRDKFQGSRSTFGTVLVRSLFRAVVLVRSLGCQPEVR